MSSSGNTASSNASVRNGWSRTNNAIRSVVSHPLALPLVLCLRFFDDVDTVDTRTMSGDHFMSNLQSLLSQPDNISTEENPSTKLPSTLEKLLNMAWLVNDLKFTETVNRVFDTFPLVELHTDVKDVINGMRSKGSNETELVAEIRKTFHSCQQKAEEKNCSASSLLFRSEGGVKSPNETSQKHTMCRYDLLVARYKDGGSCCTPILLFEFGLVNSIWWRKLDQACNYLDLLKLPEDIKSAKKLKVAIEPLCDKPVLMSTITIDKGTGAFKIALFLCWRHRVTSTKTTSQENVETINEMVAQLSVSNESKKDKKVTEVFAEGFDMILLWRTMWNPDGQVKQQNTKEENGKNIDYPGSNEFAKALVAIFFAMQCMDNWQREECSNNFSVLGPNCCKVKLLQVR